MTQHDPVALDTDLYGTWVETPEGKLGIIRHTMRWNEAGYEDCYIVIPTAGHYEPGEQIWDSDELTLRPDLPRAWNPDGTPPKGEWIYYTHDEEGHAFPRTAPSARTTSRRWITEEEPHP